MSEVWFTGDTHFGHAAVIRYSKRPFASAEEMDEGIIERWNAAVKPHDLVWHLGDVSFRRPEQTANILARLNGRKNLIRGNHDARMPAWLAGNYFHDVSDYAEIKGPSDVKIVLSHYPMMTWNKAHHGSWHLHGHSHGSLRHGLEARRIDVGVDAHAYRPWSMDDIATAMARKPGYEIVDHHGDKGASDAEPTQILRNAARCLECGTEAVSRHRHDMSHCLCGNVMRDGGQDYIRQNIPAGRHIDLTWALYKTRDHG